jgi:L,D-transpeptidase ErfK/SrfK
MYCRCLKYFVFLLALSCSSVFALKFHLPDYGSSVIGRVKTVSVPSGYDITDIGQEYHVGYLEFLEANPGININHLWAGEKIIAPTRYILPQAPRSGIVINLAELRLYYYPKDQPVVYTFPVGIGRERSPTPLLTTNIISKRANPIWIPTADTHAEAKEKGIMLPRRVMPGPQNPLGEYAIRLGMRTYLIHGTNDPSGVGIRSSGGCIRMFPSDVEKLFHLVKIGTSVHVVEQSIKIGWRGNVLYLESHVPVKNKRDNSEDTLRMLMKIIGPEARKWQARIDWQRAILAAEQQRGIPIPIGRR